MIANELGSPPVAWVQSILRNGRGLVLFDGLDEIPNLHRETARREIQAIVETYPTNFFLVSTRPEAVAPNWLESLGFQEARVNPMTEIDRSKFIDKWHEAVAVELGKLGKPAGNLSKLASELKQQLPANPAVARLATNPLLCAMICALHRDRSQKLPETPSELCEYLCEVLLHRRERESGLDLSEFPEAYRELTYPQKRFIVQEIARFMVLNEESSIRTEQARAKIGEALGLLAGPSERDASVVLDSLVERSGMFREAKPGHLDFIHNTFKEYLAGESFANSGDAGLLIKEALNSSWHRVVLFAVATPRQGFAKDILSRLIHLANQANSQSQRRIYEILALQGRAAALLIGDKDLERDLDNTTRTVFPPRNMSDAWALASTVDAAVPFLRFSWRFKAREAAACVRTLRLIGTPLAKAALETYLDDARETVVSELSQAVDPITIKEVQRKIRGGYALSDAILRQVSNLSAITSLTGIHTLRLSGAPISDLSPLADISSLRRLFLSGTEAQDLSPLARLTSLQVLDISRTPAENLEPIAELSSLHALILDQTGAIDLSPLNKLKQLQTLSIGRITARNFDFLAKLKSLQVLNLSYTKISDLSPLTRLTSLKFLYLAGTKVADISPLSSLKKLQLLSLSGTPTSNLAPVEFLSSLQALFLNNTPITELSTLAKLNQLQELSINKTHVIDLSPLDKLSSLKLINFADTNVSDISPLAALTSLQYLDFSKTAVEDIAPLAGLKSLQGIDMRRTLVIDVKPLAGLSALQYLNLSESQLQDTSSLVELKSLRQIWLNQDQARIFTLLNKRGGLRIYGYDHSAQAFSLGGTGRRFKEFFVPRRDAEQLSPRF